MVSNTFIKAHNPDYLFMIENAVRAPSSHNSQPWLFKINEESIEIHPNYRKSLPIVDNDNRELFVSLGCALENLCISAAMRGYDNKTEISKDGIIKVYLLKNNEVTADSLLFNQIYIQQTNRGVFDGNKIGEDKITVLRNLSKQESVNIYFYENGLSEFDSIKAYIEKGNRSQMKDKEFKKELKSWMRFNKKHSENTNDGLSYLVFGAPNLPRFISKPVMSLALHENIQVKSDNKKVSSASHLVLFTVKNNTLPDWINLGRTLQRFLLKSTCMDIAHSYYNQPNEISSLSADMVKDLNLDGEYPVILLRIGYGNKMPYSKRKSISKVLLK